MGEKLEACPFCGGAGHLQFSEFEISSGWHVVCHGRKECPLYCSEPYRSFDTGNQAIAAWNTRATPDRSDDALAEENRRLREALDLICAPEFALNWHMHYPTNPPKGVAVTKMQDIARAALKGHGL